MVSKIVDGYKASLSKFEEITGLNKELRDLIIQRDEVIKRVIRYYNIIFKNISSKRKEVRLTDNSQNKKNIYLVTKAGLTRKDEWQINSINLTSIPKVEFLKELVFISNLENRQAFKKVLSKQKYKIFDNFMKKAKLLELQDTFEIKTNKELKDYRLNNSLILEKISLNYNNINLFVVQKTAEKNSKFLVTPTINVPLYNMTLENLSFLEQIIPETKKLILISKKNKIKEMENLTKFIEYLRTKFENQLVLEELYSKPNMR